ncbi:MAG: TonB family protein [Pseudomonadota bacterium]
MTTAIFAKNAAPNGARVAVWLPSGRTLALAASCALHAGIAYCCHQHLTRGRVVIAAGEVGFPVLEISVAPSNEPTPVVEAAPRSTLSAPTRAVVSARSPATVSAGAGSTQIVARATAANEPAVGQNNAAPVKGAPADAPGSAQPAAARFILQAPLIVAGVGAPLARVAADSANPPPATAPFPEAAVDTPAKLQTGSPPSYTPAAEAAGVEAELPLEVVIDAGGAVQSARALEHVGYGLDEAALAAVRRYRFSAARRAGNAVAVRMRWVLRFQLR